MPVFVSGLAVALAALELAAEEEDDWQIVSLSQVTLL